MREPSATPTTAPPTTAEQGVVFTDAVLRRFLFGVVIAMTAVVSGVAAAAFYTSLEAIRSFAERSGGINPRHAWLAPLLVDSFIFVASAADLWCSATGASRAAEGWWQQAVTWLPKALLALAAGGSFALNVAHAPTHIGARVVAALAPAALVLTFEILMMIVRRAVAARVARLRAQPGGPASEQPSVTLARSDRPPLRRAASTATGARPWGAATADAPGGRGRRSAAAAARVAAVTRLYLDGVTVAEEIARRLELPPSTARRLLSQVKREGAMHLTSSGGERAAQPIGERTVGQRPAALDGERTPAAARRAPQLDHDRQPPGQALVALTREGGAAR